MVSQQRNTEPNRSMEIHKTFFVMHFGVICKRTNTFDTHKIKFLFILYYGSQRLYRNLFKPHGEHNRMYTHVWGDIGIIHTE